MILRIATVLAGVSWCATAAAGQDSAAPLLPDVVKAWEGAGATSGWMRDLPPVPSGGHEFWRPFRDGPASGALPAFRYHPERPGDLGKMPDPGVPFGLDTHCSPMSNAQLKAIAGLTSLRSLNLGAGLQNSGAGLKQLAPLKDLKGLYLFYARVTDDGLKELAPLKELRVLDLSHTRITSAGLKHLAALEHLQALNLGANEVTDAGLQDLAKLKNLRWLNLRDTEVTAAGVAALRKELQGCEIVFRQK